MSRGVDDRKRFIHVFVRCVYNAHLLQLGKAACLITE